jgi:hypothetical protein
VTSAYIHGMRHLALTLLLSATVAFALLRPGPAPVDAEEPKKDGPEKGEKPEEGKTEEEGDDFFEGETSFSKEQVEKAINNGIKWLRKKQDGDGGWGPLGGGNRSYGGGDPAATGGTSYLHPAGPTSLALYTLLKCKVSPKDPSVVKGFKYLQNKNLSEPEGSYEVSMLLLALCATADQDKSTKASEKKVEKLTLAGPMRLWAQDLVKVLKDKRTARGWRYQVSGAPPTAGGEEDVSSTQLAALALFSAHRLGIRVPASVWEDILSFTMEQQEDTGPETDIEDPINKTKIKTLARGFNYTEALQDDEMNRITGSMTACGVGNVMMARFVLTDGGKKRAEWDKRPDAQTIQKSVNDGLGWLKEHWSPFANPNKGNIDVYHMYWLYSFERMMDLIDMQRLGTHMWYNEMGQQILNRQAENGHWDTGSTHEPRDVLDTCFALLFLKRATKGTIPFPSLTGGSEDAPADNR